MVSSKDGTQIYTSGTGPSTNIDPTRLSQINKLIKVNNLHLKTAPSTKDPVFPIGQGGGDTFLLRPAVSGTAEQIGDTSPGPSLTPFQFPVSGTNPAIYTFTKVIQFSPRGEARMNNTSYNLEPLIEIGLEAAHGNMVNTTGSNVVALQVTGLAGNVTIYRR
jgi:hypothetical protein